MNSGYLEPCNSVNSCHCSSACAPPLPVDRRHLGWSAILPSNVERIRRRYGASVKIELFGKRLPKANLSKEIVRRSGADCSCQRNSFEAFLSPLEAYHAHSTLRFPLPDQRLLAHARLVSWWPRAWRTLGNHRLDLTFSRTESEKPRLQSSATN